MWFRDNIADVIKALEETGEDLGNWFSNNKMKLITNRSHLLFNNEEPNTLKIDDLDIKNNLSKKLVGIIFYL